MKSVLKAALVNDLIYIFRTTQVSVAYKTSILPNIVYLRCLKDGTLKQSSKLHIAIILCE